MSVKRRIKLRKPPTSQSMLNRMGDIIAAGHGTEQDAATYIRLQAENNLARCQAIISKAEAQHSWDFMDGCFKQACEIYVLASILYEKYPEHTIMSDGAFDYLGRFLLKHSKKIDPEFMRWYSITAIDLKAATGSNVVNRPPVQRMLAIHLDRSGYADRPRVLRGKAKRGNGKPADGVGKPARRIIRKAGTTDGD